MPDSKEVRLALRDAKRDWAGFIEGESPSLTDAQVKFIAARIGVANDQEACKATGVPLALVDVWRLDPGFCAIEQTAFGNKREGFRILTTHMLGKAVLRIYDLLDSASMKDVAKGVTLLARVQGMLVDGQKLIDKDDLATLMERLRSPVRIEPLPGPVVEGEFTESAG